jgi:hypothetical protein
MVIVETPEQFEVFMSDAKKHDWILIPILTDTKLHELENSICTLYVKLIDCNLDYLLTFDHSESLNLSIEYMSKLNIDNKKYVFDKKGMYHIYPFDNLIDVNLMHYMRTNAPLEIDHLTTTAHQFFHIKFYKLPGLNKLIPLQKHLEYCRMLTDELVRFIDDTYYNAFYNELVMNNLIALESPGLISDEGKQYTNYNIYTTTGRASNRFGGVNFSAMNKKDDTRDKYISRFEGGYLVDLDYTANHLVIIADLIDYEFPKDMSPHEYLGRMYYDSDELTEEQYTDSKKITFRLLYGGIDKEFEKIEFFEKVNMYIRSLWKSYKKRGYIESPISKKRIEAKNLDKMNSQKLFNYMLQLVEFEEMQDTFEELIEYLKSKQTEFILYLYDSMLFDFNPDDGIETLFDIKRILEFGNKSMSVKMGKSYGDMKNIDNYFTQ